MSKAIVTSCCGIKRTFMTDADWDDSKDNHLQNPDFGFYLFGILAAMGLACAAASFVIF